MPPIPVNFTTLYNLLDIVTINNIIEIKTIDPNRYTAPYKQTRWVVGSSLLFLVPSVYSYKNNQLFLSSLLGLTSAISVNYWRNATYSWRRIMDRIFSKISFTIFLVTGVKHINKIPHIICGYSGLFGIGYFYYMSNKNSWNENANSSIINVEENVETNNEIWWKYHMAFHFLSACSQTIVIHSVINNAK